MPKYEYACKSCGEHIEVVQTFADEPLTDCPACGGQLRKVFGNIGIAFKGSGFYRTDNRKRRQEPKTDSKGDGGKAEPKAGSGADGSGGDGGGGSGGDSKAEPAKKEAAPAAESKPKAAEAKTA